MQPTTDLQLGDVLFFTRNVQGSWSWDGNPARSTISGEIDIQTPYMDLEAKRTIVSASLLHVIHPNASGVRLAVNVTDTEIVGNAHEKKKLRVKFDIVTNGDAQARVETINLHGIIVKGRDRSNVDMNSHT